MSHIHLTSLIIFHPFLFIIESFLKLHLLENFDVALGLSVSVEVELEDFDPFLDFELFDEWPLFCG